MNTQLTEALKVVAAYDAIARKFVDKVESGKAVSRETYRELKEALRMSNQVQAEIEAEDLMLDKTIHPAIKSLLLDAADDAGLFRV